MRITIDIDEAPGAKATVVSSGSETVQVSGGSVRTDLLARRHSERRTEHVSRESVHEAPRQNPQPEGRYPLNPLRAGAAIERRALEEQSRGSVINAGPPAHLAGHSAQPEVHSEEKGRKKPEGKSKHRD